MSEYTKQAEDFMARHGLEFRAVHIGSDCPTFCEDAENGKDMDKLEQFPRKSHIHGNHYHVTISAKDRGHFTIDFWNSYADEFDNYVMGNRPKYKEHYDRLKTLNGDKKRRTPSPYDVLACLTKYDPGTFENFCGEFGYDTDSRRAEQVYFAVQKEWSKVRRFFTTEEIAELAEIN